MTSLDGASRSKIASARLIRQASSKGNPKNNDPEQEPLLNRAQTFDSHLFDSAIDDPSDHDDYHLSEPDPFGGLPIYQNIWKIRRKLLQCIKDPYTLEQIRSPRLTSSTVRPLLEKFIQMDDISIVFCLLVNRVQFIKDQSYEGHYLSVSTTRALFCEVLATRLLRHFDNSSSGAKGLLLIAHVVVAGFDPFQGCPEDLQQLQTSRYLEWAFNERQGREREMNALEVAILSESKVFLSSPACQKVVDAIYAGRIVYTPSAFFDIIPDHYKPRPISLYEPTKEHMLNQYRLAVPRVRNWLEIWHFVVLLALYLTVMSTRNIHYMNGWEIVFCVYAWGWILDQTASILEHGWKVYTQNLWSFLDVAFSIIYVIYFSSRLHGLNTGLYDINKPALDILAMAAPFLIPRLAFNFFSQNLLFVSMRDMMAQFAVLTFLAFWSFTGFYLSLSWLDKGANGQMNVFLWLIYVWFGLDATGINKSLELHWLLGPMLTITFAILGNTLFLTILVSMLSNTFSNIAKNPAAEIAFRRAVLTFEAVKSDALFAYQPPFNLLALLILLPLKTIISPRWFHKVNITAVRVLNAPLLLLIGVHDRHSLWPSSARTWSPRLMKLNKRIEKLWQHFSALQVHGDIQAVFKAEPADDIEEIDIPASDGAGDMETFMRGSFSRRQSMAHDPNDDKMAQLEKRLGRMEKMLGKLGKSIENLNQDDDGS